MGGPCGRVFLPRKWGEEKAKARRIFEQMGTLREPALSVSTQVWDNWQISDTSVIGGTYKSTPRPFAFDAQASGEHGEDPGDFGPLCVAEEFGFWPEMELQASAYSNQGEDHQILAELLLYFAEAYSGVISLDGLLVPFWDEEITGYKWYWHAKQWSDIEPFVTPQLRSIPGKIIAAPHIVTAERVWAYHICDTTFLRSWMKRPNFRMVK